MSASEDNLHSSYRESMLEHLLVGAIMRHLWLEGFKRLEVLKPQVDNSGYDLVLEANRVTRHVQLKASRRGAATPRVNVHRALAEKPSGCVIWTFFDANTLLLGPFLWFGAEPGMTLPDLAPFPIGAHTKANALGVKTRRPNIHSVPKGAFGSIESLAGLVERLFGAYDSAVENDLGQ